jgi:hypothetical protein
VIKPDKVNNALYALQGVLVQARFMAHQGESHHKLAEILDAAEYLPFLIVNKTDETDHFRGCIADIATKFKCAYVLNKFDEPTPPGW